MLVNRFVHKFRRERMSPQSLVFDPSRLFRVMHQQHTYLANADIAIHGQMERALNNALPVDISPVCAVQVTDGNIAGDRINQHFGMLARSRLLFEVNIIAGGTPNCKPSRPEPDQFWFFMGFTDRKVPHSFTLKHEGTNTSGLKRKAV